jgi:agmatine deiminase
MPAEWEPHAATWLAWPHNEETWPGKLPEIEEIYLQMIEALTGHEKVHLLVDDEAERERVDKKLSKHGLRKNVVYFLVPTVDAWVRDYGPNFIRKEDGKIAFVNWMFNAWGGKYESLARDNQVPDRLAPLLGVPVFSQDIVLEGGSIDTNGKGTVLVTEQCLLNSNRNPGLSRSGIEEILQKFLGLTHFIWLGEGIEGDDTDGHIDDITRFVNPATVVTAVEKNSADRNYAPLQENLKRLKQATDRDGKKLTLATLPMPNRVEASWGRLPASYLNFYIANGVVLVPIFGHPRDGEALKILGELFPKRRIVGIRSESLVLGLGGIHCVTHEQPASY